MPFATAADSTRLYYRLEGSPEKPLLVLVHSLGADHGLWAAQMPALLRFFQVLRCDLRGHGASDAPGGGYTIQQLAEDVLSIAPRPRFFYCGLSLGGMIGQYLAAKHPERIERLVLANTSARVAEPALYGARAATVLAEGMATIAEASLQRSFSSPAHPAANSIRVTLLATDPAGYAGCCAAIRDMDQRGLLGLITAPTLVIGGDEDVSTPWEGNGSLLAAGIPGARACKIAAAHLSNLERPAAFTRAVLEFLLPAPASDPRAAGETMRRAMLGDAHVDRSQANATDFTRGFQELITRYAWGTLWTRPGMEPRLRRLLVLAITASLGRWEEFRLHLRAGLNGEPSSRLEEQEVEEVLLQVAVYAGLPAANTAFHIAAEELAAPGHAG